VLTRWIEQQFNGVATTIETSFGSRHDAKCVAGIFAQVTEQDNPAVQPLTDGGKGCGLAARGVAAVSESHSGGSHT